MFCEQNAYLKCYLTYLCHDGRFSCIILLDLYRVGHQISNRLNPNGSTTDLDLGNIDDLSVKRKRNVFGQYSIDFTM